MNEMPTVGSRWRHYKGGLYEVVCVAMDKTTGLPKVVYRSLEDGQVWAQPLALWQSAVGTDAGIVPRFVPTDD